jgi:hypothetical protein
VYLIVVYVDDLIIADNNKELKAAFVRELKNRFSMKDMGELHWCLGMRAQRNREQRIIFLDQEKYIGDVLQRFGMQGCKGSSNSSGDWVEADKAQ